MDAAERNAEVYNRLLDAEAYLEQLAEEGKASFLLVYVVTADDDKAQKRFYMIAGGDQTEVEQVAALRCSGDVHIVFPRRV